MSNCSVQGCENEAVDARTLARLDAFMEDGTVVRLPVHTEWCEDHRVCEKVYEEFHAMFSRATRQDAEILRINQMVDAEMTGYSAEPVTEEEMEQVENDEADLRAEIERAIAERLAKTSSSLGEKLPADKPKRKRK